jgi:hypothetical protein
MMQNYLSHHLLSRRIHLFKSYFIRICQIPTKNAHIALKLSTQSVNTLIFYFQKVYATVHPFFPQLIEQLTMAQSAAKIGKREMTTKRCEFYIQKSLYFQFLYFLHIIMDMSSSKNTEIFVKRLHVGAVISYSLSVFR